MLLRQITVCHGPCCPPGRVNLDCSPSVCPKPSTHWSHRLFTGISLHSSHYLGLACQGRFAPMKQSSHSLAFNKVFCRPNEAEDEWKAKKLFWTHSGETKIFGFFFFFWEWRKEPWIAAYQWVLQSCTEHGKEPYQCPEWTPWARCQLGLSHIPRTNNCLPARIHGEKLEESFSFPQHLLSHFHAVCNSVVVRVIHAFQIW